VHGALSFNNSLAVKTAALAGAGIGRVARWLVEEELRAGQLREVLPGVAPPPVPVFATYLPSHFPTEKVRGLIRFVAKSLPRLPGWIPPAQLTAAFEASGAPGEARPPAG
jgi:DNA-binding transcriptional LysR family regulator